MATTIEERLHAVQTEMENAKTRRIQAETRLESARKRKEELTQRCESDGLNPNELDEQIAKYEQEIEEGIRQLEASLQGKPAPQPQSFQPSSSGELPF